MSKKKLGKKNKPLPSGKSEPNLEANSSESGGEGFEIQFDLADELEQANLASADDKEVEENLELESEVDEDFATSELQAVESELEELSGTPGKIDVAESDAATQPLFGEDLTELEAEAPADPEPAEQSELQLPFLEFEEIIEGELQGHVETILQKPSVQKQVSIPSLNFEEALNLEGQVEALLFASNKPLKSQDIIEILHDVGEEKCSLKDVEKTIQSLMRWYEEKGGGFRLEAVKGMGYQFQTVPSAARLMERLFASRPRPLSRAALETLSIIAYRQPVTRADVEYIRGVDAGSIIKNLLDRELIACVGRKEDSGRPMLFGTTDEFLKVFRLQSLSDLPPLAAFQPSPDSIGKALDDLDEGIGQDGVDIEPFIGDESLNEPEVSGGLDQGTELDFSEEFDIQLDEFTEPEEEKAPAAQGASKIDRNSSARAVQGAVFHASDSSLDQDVEPEDRGDEHDQGSKISFTIGSELPEGSGEVDTGGADFDQRPDRPATRNLD